MRTEAVRLSDSRVVLLTLLYRGGSQGDLARGGSPLDEALYRVGPYGP